MQARLLMEAPVLMQVNGSVAHITLNRPQQLNAMDIPALAALGQALAEAAAHVGVRAVLLSAHGNFFSVGGNLQVFRETLQGSSSEKTAAFSRLIDEAHSVIQLISTLRVPVVMVIQGGASGVALSLMAAADFVMTHEESTFSSAYMRVGATPDGGATWWMPRLMGMRQARKLLMLSERFSGKEAQDLGLVDRVVELADLQREALAFAQRLASGPTSAYGSLKKLLAHSLQTDLATQLEAEKASFLACTKSVDMQEGIRAFLGKDSTRFIGS